MYNPIWMCLCEFTIPRDLHHRCKHIKIRQPCNSDSMCNNFKNLIQLLPLQWVGSYEFGSILKFRQKYVMVIYKFLLREDFSILIDVFILSENLTSCGTHLSLIKQNFKKRYHQPENALKAHFGILAFFLYPLMLISICIVKTVYYIIF